MNRCDPKRRNPKRTRIVARIRRLVQKAKLAVPKRRKRIHRRRRGPNGRRGPATTPVPYMRTNGRRGRRK
jgi:hypothetical protein